MLWWQAQSSFFIFRWQHLSSSAHHVVPKPILWTLLFEAVPPCSYVCQELFHPGAVSHIDGKFNVCKKILSFLMPEVFHCILIPLKTLSCLRCSSLEKAPFLISLLISYLFTLHSLSCFVYRLLMSFYNYNAAAVSLYRSHLTFPPRCSITVIFRPLLFLTVNVCPLVPNDFQCENNYSSFYLISPSLSHTVMHAALTH